MRSQHGLVDVQDGEDTPMASSPYMSSPAMKDEDGVLETPLQTVITLVKEESLEEVKARYDQVTSIHIYSLGPTSIQNIQLLTECGRQVSVSHANEDPLVHNKTYGIIQNSGVRRRTGRRPPPPPAVVEPKTVLPVKSSIATENRPGAAVKYDSTSSRPSTLVTVDSRPVSSKGPDKKPTLKKEQSDIFKSFAKKPAAKLKREGTDSSAAPSPALQPQEDGKLSTTPTQPFCCSPITNLHQALMKDAALSSSDEDDFIPPPIKQSKATTTRPSRTEREEKLRQMMDDDDDDEEDDNGEGNDVNENSEMVDASSPSNPIDAPEPSKSQSPSPPPPAPEVSNGRRRGQRKVMKKKTMKDAEGYLITKEEPVWESFSEEDKPTPVPKPKMQVEGNKGKVTSSAKGQGNLMSFFGKSAKK